MLLHAGVELDVFGASHVGRVRENNEDQFLVARLHKVIEVDHTSLPKRYRQRFDSGARAVLLLVADGVGGGAGGEEASSLALDTIVGYVTNSMRCFYQLDDQVQADLMAELEHSVAASHQAVQQEGSRSGSLAGMATTLTMAHVLWPRAYLVQIGDSRAYHLSGGRIRQLTRDQTVGQELVDQGILEPADLAASPMSNVLARAIGGGEVEIRPEIGSVELAEGDGLLLCTDGLTRHVSDDEIAATVTASDSAEAAAGQLIELALERGGRDNVTVVVARFSAPN